MKSEFWSHLNRAVRWRARWRGLTLPEMTRFAADGYSPQYPGKNVVMPWIPVSTVDSPPSDQLRIRAAESGACLPFIQAIIKCSEAVEAHAGRMREWGSSAEEQAARVAFQQSVYMDALGSADPSFGEGGIF